MTSLRSGLLAAIAVLASSLPATLSAPTARAPASVPIAIGGKEADISIDFISLMLPEYDGV